jgi:hypothetical protein
LNVFNLKYCAMKLEISLGSNEVQCLLYDNVLKEVISLKQILDTCSVHAMCVYLQCRLDYVLLFAILLFSTLCVFSTKSHCKNSFDHTHNKIFCNKFTSSFMNLRNDEVSNAP